MILRRVLQASPDQTQAKAYVTEEIGTIGCEASPVLYGIAVKQTYKGEVSVAYAKPSDNLVEAVRCFGAYCIPSKGRRGRE